MKRRWKIRNQFAADALDNDLLFDEYEPLQEFTRTNVSIHGELRTFFHRPEIQSPLVKDLAKALSYLEECSHGWAGADSTHDLYQQLERIMKRHGVFERYNVKKEMKE